MIDISMITVEVWEEVRNTLCVFDEVTVSYGNGEYHCTPSNAVLGWYPDDFKVIGKIYKEDIFTPEEIIENFINNFYSYPPQYKGERDYNVLRRLENKHIVDEDGVSYCISPYGKLDKRGNFHIVGDRKEQI